MRKLLILFSICTLALLASQAQATVMTFEVVPDVNDPISGSLNLADNQFFAHQWIQTGPYVAPYRDYGDRVNAPSVSGTYWPETNDGTGSKPLANATLNYGVGAEGYTPNVSVLLWANDYFNRTKYYQSWSGMSDVVYNNVWLFLEPDVGYTVTLHDFKAASWSGTYNLLYSVWEPSSIDDTTGAVTWGTKTVDAQDIGAVDDTADTYTLDLTYDTGVTVWLSSTNPANVAFDDIRFSQAGSGSLPGDLNGDGFVGGDDLDIVRSFWGQEVTPGNKLKGDPSGDGFVGGDDLDEVRAHWGEGTPPAPGAVPEPHMCVFFGVGLLSILLARRCSRGR